MVISQSGKFGKFESSSFKRLLLSFQKNHKLDHCNLVIVVQRCYTRHSATLDTVTKNLIAKIIITLPNFNHVISALKKDLQRK